MWFHSPVLGELAMGWLTVAGSEPSNLNINRSLLLLTRITYHDKLKMPKDLILRLLMNTLYTHILLISPTQLVK